NGWLAWIVKEFANAMEQRLAGAVIGSANRHDSIENREATARRPIEFGVQVGICCEQGLQDLAVESIELAMGASGGRGRIRRASEQTDFTNVVAGSNEASRSLPRWLRMLADFKNSRDDDEKHGFSSTLREQHLLWFERSRLQLGGQFGQL